MKPFNSNSIGNQTQSLTKICFQGVLCNILDTIAIKMQPFSKLFHFLQLNQTLTTIRKPL